jgi:hypothetical protein
MRLIGLGFIACALATAVPASAQVYRWVDDRGVINYASKPPDGRAAVRIDQQESRISVIPAAARASRASPAATLPPVSAGFPGPVDQATVGSLQPRYPDWRSRCIAERRVDCDYPSAATFDVVPSLAQQAPSPFGPLAP